MRTLLATGNSTASACVEDFEAGPPESKEMADRYAATSPFSWADGSDPASILANGLQDRLVPATQAAQLVAMLDSIQVRASLALSSTDHHATGLEHDSVAGESATVVSAALAFLTQTL
jgi:hypothetical protein